jgi:hypothetical protein
MSWILHVSSDRHAYLRIVPQFRMTFHDTRRVTLGGGRLVSHEQISKSDDVVVVRQYHQFLPKLLRTILYALGRQTLHAECLGHRLCYREKFQVDHIS